jgi:siroheme synthase-like protein
MQSFMSNLSSFNSQKTGNELFPVFIKLNQVHLLLVGAGNVGLEKLSAILRNSPRAKLFIVAPFISQEVKKLIKDNSLIQFAERSFEDSDIIQKDIIICATDNKGLHQHIYHLAKQKNILINVADTPDLCDFYLGSIVQKGDLKIAISTNGKSPTVAKRIREVINDIIPNEVDEMLSNMQHIRNSIHGDFDEKVKHLNELTKVLVSKQAVMDNGILHTKKWSKVVLYCLLAFVVILISHGLLSMIHFGVVLTDIKESIWTIDLNTFLLMLLTGFIAQMIDGSMGLGYGTISTTILLAIGVPPAIVSSRVHSARVFSSGVSGYSHNRYGNINKKLFRTIVWPGVIGAILGAGLAVFAQHANFSWVRIPLSIYTTYLGYYIIKKAFNKKQLESKVKGAGWLAAVGGFMDAFAGGGWGALVTSTLISKRKSPRFVVGSVCLAEFFVVFASAVTFFVLLKHLPILEVLGLILGGVIAGPIAAKLVGKIPIKTMYVLVGLVVILTSLFTLYKVTIKYF